MLNGCSVGSADGTYFPEGTGEEDARPQFCFTAKYANLGPVPDGRVPAGHRQTQFLVSFGFIALAFLVYRQTKHN